MNLNIKDVIKLEDNIEYAIVSTTVYEDIKYYYLIGLDSDDNIKFGYIEDDSFGSDLTRDILEKYSPDLEYSSRNSIIKLKNKKLSRRK